MVGGLVGTACGCLSTSPMDGGLVGTACGWTNRLLLCTEDCSAPHVDGLIDFSYVRRTVRHRMWMLVDFSYGRRTCRHRLWMDFSTSPFEGEGLIGTACGWTGRLFQWTEDWSEPPVDGLVDFSNGRRTGRHRLWMDWSTFPVDGGLVGTACGWTGRLFQWTEDWSAPPVDGLVDFSSGRRTSGSHLRVFVVKV